MMSELEVDGNRIAEVRCEPYEAEGPTLSLASKVVVAAATGYERNRRNWQQMLGRCWVVASQGPTTTDRRRLEEYVRKALVERKKAAVLQRDEANRVVAVLAPVAPEVDGRCLCLYEAEAGTTTERHVLRIAIEGQVVGEAPGLTPSPLHEANEQASINNADGWLRGAKEWTSSLGDGEWALASTSAEALTGLAASLHRKNTMARLTVRDVEVARLTAAHSPNALDVWLPRSAFKLRAQRKRPQSEPAAAEISGGNTAEADAATAAEFYNKLERSQDEQSKSQIFHLRRMNNWVKATLIEEAARSARFDRRDPLRILDLACGKGGDLAKWARAKPVARYAGVDIAETSLTDLLARLGDMDVFKRADPPTEIVLTAANLGDRSLRERGGWRRLDPETGAWRVADATETALSVAHSSSSSSSEKKQGGANDDDDAGCFDVASIQFALHYVFHDAAKADVFFADVAASLRPLGVLVATTVDARALCRLILARGVSTRQSPHGGKRPHQNATDALWWRADVEDETAASAATGLRKLTDQWAEPSPRVPLTVWMEDDVRARLVAADPSKLPDDDGFGLRYWFQLRDSADSQAVDSPEWLVPPNLLCDLAQRHGLHLEASENLADFLRTRLTRADLDTRTSLARLGVPDHFGSLSPGDWDILGLYTTLVFRRTPSDSQMMGAFSAAKRKFSPQAWADLAPEQKKLAVNRCVAGK